MGRRIGSCIVCLLVSCAAFSIDTSPLIAPRLSVRTSSVQMGRAEKRAAKKQSKKSTSGRAKAAARDSFPAKKDVLTREEVIVKLREIPVFGIMAPGSNGARGGFLVLEDGIANFFLDFREAEQACDALRDKRLQVKGVPLDEIYFDTSTRLKASDRSWKQAREVMKNAPVNNVKVPLFCIDGMIVEDKTTGIASSPIFFCKDELLEFARTCMDNPEDRILLTDLSVLVQNMVIGPAGLLRNVKFFPTAAALVKMDEQSNVERQSLFPDAGPVPEDAPWVNPPGTGARPNKPRTEVSTEKSAAERSIATADPESEDEGVFPGLKNIFPW